MKTFKAIGVIISSESYFSITAFKQQALDKRRKKEGM